MNTPNPSSLARFQRVVGPLCVFGKLAILPIMMAVELILLLSVFVVGIIRPRLGLNLSDWFCDHLPDRDWYWERPMNVRSRRPNTTMDCAGHTRIDSAGHTRIDSEGGAT